MKEQWGAYPDLYFYIGGLLYGLPSQKKNYFVMYCYLPLSLRAEGGFGITLKRVLYDLGYIVGAF
jgi:hypothetical protein